MSAAPDPERVAAGLDPAAKAHVLVEALPWIRELFGTTVVVKLGGNAMVDPDLAERFAEDVALLHAVGLRVVVVHGGGPQIGELLERLGIDSEFRDGRRVTDAETLDVARMVLVGKVNRDLVSAINVHGGLAVGLSGEDASLIVAAERDPELGFVGDVLSVNPRIVEKLLDEALIPVVSTIGADATGQSYNINADTVAGALAGALGAGKAVYLTDVAGVLADPEDPATLVSSTTPAALRAMIEDGSVSGGMIPKVEACIEALDAGARSAHLLDGRVPHALLLEIFTDEGVGTMVVPDPPVGLAAAVRPAGTVEA